MQVIIYDQSSTLTEITPIIKFDYFIHWKTLISFILYEKYNGD